LIEKIKKIESVPPKGIEDSFERNRELFRLRKEVGRLSRLAANLDAMRMKDYGGGAMTPDEVREAAMGRHFGTMGAPPLSIALPSGLTIVQRIKVFEALRSPTFESDDHATGHVLLDGRALRFEISGAAIRFRFTGESARTEKESARTRAAERARDQRRGEHVANAEQHQRWER